MKTLRDQEEVEEVELEETSEEEELGEEDQEDVITVMRKVSWLEIVLIQGGHGALTAETMGHAIEDCLELIQNGKIEYDNEELTSSVPKSRELVRDNFPTLISLLEEEQRQELMLILYPRSRKKHQRKTCMTL
jgi:hypothetical protein